ncbi:CocE/NonD family hydrolase [Mycobacteroides franklinii]|uniref:CocE/NonD family hydrolase n=1 Tax=Mycobacteroides franklinii TaxID=948102 RepID=A0A4V3HV66_9MYCO|nr:CocE/NonD family hydrolase [Mycobacteroides franklinii]ORA60555.1 peptidase S15 [Mycobacteroides franklinii]TDH22278.1 CocE/NonD family hydrolase [Mycobacteroides franklinii]TDZ43888.1 Cocaine esterase [Mycobacteroides franklinii]TDZ51023.1 Cocaine esterase [Mycobacteroides franklinii]TDZ57443.1 Cocaine esterase [Mycobacteroides franklinii]
MVEQYAPRSELRDGMRIEWDVRITMDDGITLAADIFRPDDDAAHPVLLAASPYGKGLPFQVGYADNFNAMMRAHPEIGAQSSSKYQVWEYPDPERWVPQGYVCVRIDTRGAGGSEGAIDIFSPREIEDLYACIEWAGVQPWSNGKVGMLGISYLATNQWLVAALAPPHLAAICPWEGANDFYREYAKHGGITSEFMPSWMPCQIRSVQHGHADAQINPNNGRRVSGLPVRSQAELDANAVAIGEVLLTNQYLDDYYRDRTANLEDITVPVLSCANWGGMGLHSRGNFEGFSRSASGQKWLEVHGLEHWTEFYTDYGVDLQRRFFDHFLKGAANGWDKEPSVHLKVRTPETFIQRTENEWPLDRTQWTRFYLDCADGQLSVTTPEGEQSITFEARSKGVMFTTPVLEHDIEVTGPAALKVFVASSTTDADLFVTVHLFDPLGAEVLWPTAFEPHGPVAQGWLRMSHRARDDQRSLPYRPWHTHTASDPLTPGVVYEADVEIWPMSVVAPAGYRIGLSVRGQDYTHELPGPSEKAYGRELLGSGAYWHELPGERDLPEFSGRTTLRGGAGGRPYVLLPVVPT